jgi:hypothetical protein
MIRFHFGLSPTDAGVHPARRAVAVSTPRTRFMTASASWCCRMVFSYFNLRDSIGFDQSFWNSVVSILVMIRVTTIITVTINYIQEPHNGFDLHRPAARLRTSLKLVAPNRRRLWTHYVWLKLLGNGSINTCPRKRISKQPKKNSLIYSQTEPPCHSNSVALFGFGSKSLMAASPRYM